MFGDDDEDLKQAPAWRRYGVPAVVLMFVSGGAFAIVIALKQSTPGPRPHIEQHITAITLPPPPPPPPPPKIQEKPREEQKVVAKIPQPKAPKIPSPPQQLTATAGAGTDAFGLKAGEGGGGDCVGDCGNGDGAGDDGGYFETVVKSMVSDAIERDDRLRSARYHATVSFVFNPSGHVEHVAFDDFDGDPEIKGEVAQALARMAASENIPANMANGKPWVVRLSAHAPG